MIFTVLGRCTGFLLQRVHGSEEFVAAHALGTVDPEFGAVLSPGLHAGTGTAARWLHGNGCVDVDEEALGQSLDSGLGLAGGEVHATFAVLVSAYFGHVITPE